MLIYTLPKLPYAFDALEPYIDAKTMEIHYTKHHQAYVDNLNAALAKHPNECLPSLEKMLQDFNSIPSDIREAVRNNGGGHFNHSLFWQLMKKGGGGQPVGKLKSDIEEQFGSFESFKAQLSETAKSRFGSGWAWLSMDKDGSLQIGSTPNQDTLLHESLDPIVGLDVWEHAYYLKYQNKRVDYIAAWWNVVNWQTAEDFYQIALKKL